MVGVSFLPRELITLLMKVGLNIPKKDDWHVIKNSISVLLEHWPYKELDLTTLSDKVWFQIALTHLVLDRFAAEIDSGALKKPCSNQLTEFVMRTSVEYGNFLNQEFLFVLIMRISISSFKRLCPVYINTSPVSQASPALGKCI